MTLKLIKSFLILLFIIEIGLQGAGYFISLRTQLHAPLEINNDSKFENKIDEIRVLCIGESTTYNGGSDSYPAILNRLLSNKFPDKSIYVINAGRSSINTSQIVESLKKQINYYKPNIIIFMMGINDIWSLPIFLQNNSFLKKTWVALDYIKIFKFAKLLFVNLYFTRTESEDTQLNITSKTKDSTNLLLINNNAIARIGQQNNFSINEESISGFSENEISILNSLVPNLSYKNIELWKSKFSSNKLSKKQKLFLALNFLYLTGDEFWTSYLLKNITTDRQRLETVFLLQQKYNAQSKTFQSCAIPLLEEVI